MGPAGGLDKSAKHIKAWWRLGAGFMEIGTVTPLPQKPNPRPNLMRNVKQQILWNHLGFPGEGLQKVCNRLQTLGSFRPTPIFANIGKNRWTSNKEAKKDYIQCISELHPYVDAFVINVSSPNTQELTQLLHAKNLKPLLQEVNQKLSSLKKKLPFFVKWSPDTSEKDFLMSLDTALQCGANGHIICNTTTQREKYKNFPKYGGLSGTALSQLSKHRLSLTVRHLGGEIKNQLLISVGGVLELEDILERLALGAHLVQVYSAFVFQGPGFLRRAKNL